MPALKNKNIKGETLLETVMSLGILAIGIGLATTIMASSIRNVNSSKNQIIAINIAREGIEAVRNIRDTNWLKFSSRKRECWNFDPPRDPTIKCTNSTGAIVPGLYIVYKQGEYQPGSGETFRWRLLPWSIAHSNAEIFFGIPDPQEPTEILDATDLYLVDIDPGFDSDNDGDVDNDADAYNHIYTDRNAPFDDDDALGRDAAQRTVFKREIRIKYINNDGTEVSAPGSWGLLNANEKAALNRMQITSTVIWQEGKNQFSTELVTNITDYLGRESLNL